MKANQITAIATSVIAISVIGILFNQIYTNPKNIKERCTEKYAKKFFNDPDYYSDDFYRRSSLVDEIEEGYDKCLGYKGNSNELFYYKKDNPNKFKKYNPNNFKKEELIF